MNKGTARVVAGLSVIYIGIALTIIIVLAVLASK